MSTELVLGIDIGSTTSKAALVSLDGRLVALEEIAHEISRPRPGWAEQDAEAVWWADVVALCRRLLPPAGGGRVVAAAGAALGPCLVLADAAGRPLRPAILYGIDTRATAEIEELDRRLGPAAILARCGSPLTTQAIGPKLAWLARHEPDVLAAARRLFTASSFLVHRLTGEYVLDHHSASQCVPMYDVLTNAWIDEWAAETAPGSSLPPLPPLAWPQEPAGVVTAAAAAATGLPAGIPVAAGTIDSLAEAFGAGVRASRRTSPGVRHDHVHGRSHDDGTARPPAVEPGELRRRLAQPGGRHRHGRRPGGVGARSDRRRRLLKADR